MKKKSLFLFFLLLIVSTNGFCQYGRIQHRIEVDFGCSKYEHQFGPASETRYAMGFGKHFDLLASLSVFGGVDPERIGHEFTHSQFQTFSFQLGARGNLDFLKICSLKVSCQGGIMLLERVFVEEGLVSSSGTIPPIVSGRIEHCFRLSPVTELGLFYCSTWAFCWRDARFDRFGISLSFKIE